LRSGLGFLETNLANVNEALIERVFQNCGAFLMARFKSDFEEKFSSSLLSNFAANFLN
jgi:hypothetical protein